MQLFNVSLAMYSSIETPTFLSSNFTMDSSSVGPAARLLYSLGIIAILLITSAAQWYFARPMKLSLPVAGAGTKGNKTEAMEEAQLKVS